MKNMHQCILCIGSNYRAETYMGMAEMLLNQRFPSIRWGKTVKTLPEGTTCPTPYLNRAARLDTNWDADTLRYYFKSIEKACGRTSLSKQTGIIPLQIYNCIDYSVAILLIAYLYLNSFKLVLKAFPCY